MDISISSKATPKTVTPQAPQSDKHLAKLHWLRLDKLLCETSDEWMPDSTPLTRYREEFSTLSAQVQRTVLANSRQIVPAIEDGLMCADAIAGFKALLNLLPADDQALIVMCLWYAEHTKQTSTLRKGLVQLLPLSVQDAMFAELSEPLLDEIQKKERTDSKGTTTMPTTSGTHSAEKFAFYQTGEIDQALVKYAGTTLDEMLSTGSASAIHKYRKGNFKCLEPAEKRIVLSECPGLIAAIETDDTDTLKAYQQLLNTLAPDDQGTVIGRLWQNCTTKNVGIYQGLADLLPLVQREIMRGKLAQIAQQCKKQSEDTPTTATTGHESRVVELGLQLKQAFSHSDPDAIKAIGKDFEQLSEADQIRTLKFASPQLNDVIGIRTGIFSTQLTKPATEIVDAFRYLVRLIHNPAGQVHVVVELMLLYADDMRSGVHANYADKRMDLASLMPEQVTPLTKELLSSDAQDGYSSLFAIPKMSIYNWIKSFIAAVKNRNADEVRRDEKLFELIPLRNRYRFLVATFLKREHAMCSGTGDAAVQIRAFIRLFKDVADKDRCWVGMYFSYGVINALKKRNTDVLRAFGELLDLVAKNQRNYLSSWLLESDKHALLNFFPTVNLETQQALLGIALRMFTDEVNYKPVTLYLDLISTIKDPERRTILIAPQDKAIKKQLDEATLSLYHIIRLHFTDRLQALLPTH